MHPYPDYVDGGPYRSRIRFGDSEVAQVAPGSYGRAYAKRDEQNVSRASSGIAVLVFFVLLLGVVSYKYYHSLPEDRRKRTKRKFKKFLRNMDDEEPQRTRKKDSEDSSKEYYNKLHPAENASSSDSEYLKIRLPPKGHEIDLYISHSEDEDLCGDEYYSEELDIKTPKKAPHYDDRNQGGEPKRKHSIGEEWSKDRPRRHKGHWEEPPKYHGKWRIRNQPYAKTNIYNNLVDQSMPSHQREDKLQRSDDYSINIQGNKSIEQSINIDEVNSPARRMILHQPKGMTKSFENTSQPFEPSYIGTYNAGKFNENLLISDSNKPQQSGIFEHEGPYLIPSDLEEQPITSTYRPHNSRQQSYNPVQSSINYPEMQNYRYHPSAQRFYRPFLAQAPMRHAAHNLAEFDSPNSRTEELVTTPGNLLKNQKKGYFTIPADKIDSNMAKLSYNSYPLEESIKTSAPQKPKDDQVDGNLSHTSPETAQVLPALSGQNSGTQSYRSAKYRDPPQQIHTTSSLEKNVSHLKGHSEPKNGTDFSVPQTSSQFLLYNTQTNIEKRFQSPSEQQKRKVPHYSSFRDKPQKLHSPSTQHAVETPADSPPKVTPEASHPSSLPNTLTLDFNPSQPSYQSISSSISKDQSKKFERSETLPKADVSISHKGSLYTSMSPPRKSSSPSHSTKNMPK